MATEIILNFYEEKTRVERPKNIKGLHDKISKLYGMSIEDAAELKIYFLGDNNEACLIKNNLNLNQAVYRYSKAGKDCEILIEVQESSKLYQVLNKNGEKSEITRQDLLLKEIADKENELKLLLELEQKEAERRQKEELERIEMEEAKKKVEELQRMIEANKVAEQKVEEKPISAPVIEEKQEINKPADTISKHFDTALKNIQSGLDIIQEKAIEKTKKALEQNKSFVCLGCNCEITKVRYECTVCPNFNYCEACEDKYYISHQHNFMKIRMTYEPNLLEKARTKVINLANDIDQKIRTNYQDAVVAMKMQFELSDIADNEIIEALKGVNGDITMALQKLFK